MKRDKFSLSHYKLTTGNMGFLIPLTWYEALPGDTIQQSTSVLLRCSPLVSPVMHPVVVRVHHWFVPNRLIWDGWENWITGGPDGTDGGAVGVPAVDPGGSGYLPGSLADYLGIPPAVPNITVSALPFRAYNKIWNEYYRDQDLQTEALEDANEVLRVSWEKDYFTSARPWPQKGPEVTLPLGTRAPVIGIGAQTQTYPNAAANFYETGRSAPRGFSTNKVSSTASADNNFVIEQDPSNPGFPNIWADLENASAVSVDTVRRAFAVQRYQEARARYGSRYSEYLRYLGVRSSDARLQRPEYLGGGKQTISFSEVLQTGPDTSDDGVADLKGHGIAAMRSRRFRYFFEEHGIVMSLLSVRPKSIYVNGLHRSFQRFDKETYFQKELAFIGQQEVLNNEVYAASLTGAETFGYQDRYAEYRHLPSGISAGMRSFYDDWHLARIFGSAPALNNAFIECDPGMRPFAVQDEDGLIMMANHSIQARRMVPRSAAGRII